MAAKGEALQQAGKSVTESESSDKIAVAGTTALEPLPLENMHLSQKYTRSNFLSLKNTHQKNKKDKVFPFRGARQHALHYSHVQGYP